MVYGDGFCDDVFFSAFRDMEVLMRILLVYPEYPGTFWSFKYALPFISKKAVHPPLGLLTVAAMLPHTWEKRLVDMNTSPLQEKDLEWADLVFVSAMLVQKTSVEKVIRLCVAKGVPVVAGGPLFTSESEAFPYVDYLILNEAEITLSQFMADLNHGNPKHIYSTDEFPDITRTPVPLWGLLNMSKYVSMTLQYSRGCPFQCEFCDITNLYGRKVRTKHRDQLIDELDSLYKTGWRGGVFFVDDNFIGNSKKLKQEILPAIIHWMEKKRFPFSFGTEASINLSDDRDLMEMMVRAGFSNVFVGIETPNEESLKECAKIQNRNRNMVDCVRRIQHVGLEIRGGFIVGFDNDSPSVFEKQIQLIKESRIVTAMVGLLNAPRGTRLYERVRKEGRLLPAISGDNTDASTNIVPKMGYETLVRGYRYILKDIYCARPYFERVRDFLKEYHPEIKRPFKFHPGYVRFHSGYAFAFFRSLFLLGIKDSERKYYWKLIFWTIFRRPALLPNALAFAIYGFHFRKFFQGVL
jgi:radical SAM superfamily enzyme YgiQ (UPF0313 family)